MRTLIEWLTTPLVKWIYRVPLIRQPSRPRLHEDGENIRSMIKRLR